MVTVGPQFLAPGTGSFLGGPKRRIRVPERSTPALAGVGH